MNIPGPDRPEPPDRWHFEHAEELQELDDKRAGRGAVAWPLVGLVLVLGLLWWL